MVLNDLYLLPVHLAAAGSMRSILVLLQTFLLEILLTSTFYTLIIIPFHFVSQMDYDSSGILAANGEEGPLLVTGFGSHVDGLGWTLEEADCGCESPERNTGDIL